MAHHAKLGKSDRMSEISEAMKAIIQANYATKSAGSPTIATWVRTDVCNRYCRKSERIPDDMPCGILAMLAARSLEHPTKTEAVSKSTPLATAAFIHVSVHFT